jgi:hypothetical protein
MKVLGIDPGGHVGWTVLLLSSGGNTTWLQCGVGRGWPRCEMVAIERPAKSHAATLVGSPAKIAGVVAGLLAAAWTGGEIAGAATREGATVIEVDAAEARRALGVHIGGRRRGPLCGLCGGSGASGETEHGRRLRRAAEGLLPILARRGRGQRATRASLASLRLDAAQRCPCEACGGAGEDRPPTVDQQVAALLPTAIEGWPRVSNVHERDAAVAALWAMRHLKTEQ